VGDHDHRHTVVCQRHHDVEDLVDHLRVEGRRGFVEQHDSGFHRQRPGDCDALLLPTGQLRGVLVALFGDADALEQLHRPRLCLLFGLLAHLDRGEGDVVQDRLVGEEVERLEHHAHLGAQRSEVGALIGEQGAVEVDLAAVDRFETVDRATQRRLAGARRTEEYHHLPGGDVEVDVAQHVQVAEMLVDVLQRDHRRGCHVRSP
jgi:hypothetical protein